MQASRNTRMALSWAVCLMCLLLAGAGAAAAAAVPLSCPQVAAPVCGSDGITYYNECLARMQQVQVDHPGYCKDTFFDFAGVTRDDKKQLGVTTAAAAGSTSIGKSSRLQKRLVLKERATAQLSADVVNAFAADGFVYVGKAQLAKGHTTSNTNSPGAGISTHGSSSSSSSGAAAASAGGSILPAGVTAVRFTPSGHVYVARQSQEQLQQPDSPEAAAAAVAAAAAAEAVELKPLIPPAARLLSAAPTSPLSSSPAAAAAALAAAGSSSISSSNAAALIKPGRHLSILVGEDERKTCPLGPAYPFSAIGQIDFSENNTPYICSGALIGPRRVLTAAHCVWDIDSQSFVDMLSFAPGRYRGSGGVVVNPFGQFRWTHATLMKNYLTSDETQADIAVITLEEAVPKAVGALGLKSNCAAETEAVALTTAGYPSDKPEGECMTCGCTVKFDCTKESIRHKCDTYMGQSGSALWDPDYYVRGVHVRGLVDEQENEFTTINRRVLGKIKEWEGREYGGVV